MNENPPNPDPVEVGAAEPAPEAAVTQVQPPPPPPYTPASMPPPQPQPPQAAPPSPPQPPTPPYEATREQISHRRRNTVAVVLIVLGVFSLMGQFLPSWSWDKWWPLILIVIGAFIIFQGRSRKS